MKKQRLILAVCLMAGVCTTGVLAHQDEAASPRTPQGEKLGRVLFTTSCTPEAQKEFERALGMLHSFFFPETVQAFTKVTEIDPGCAIAYWGLAVSTRPNPLVGPWDAATLKRGLDAVDKGKVIGAKTQRERDWLAAIEEERNVVTAKNTAQRIRVMVQLAQQHGAVAVTSATPDLPENFASREGGFGFGIGTADEAEVICDLRFAIERANSRQR